MNLLTDPLKRRARTELLTNALWRIGALLLCEGIVVAIALLLGSAIMERAFATTVERSSLVLRASGGTPQRVRTINELLLALERLRDRYTPWTIVFTSIADRTPTAITLTAITIDAEQRVRIDGRAATREALLTFRDAVTGLPLLRDVAVPFSNLLQRERIDFSIDARVDRRAIPRSPPTPL